MNRLLSTAAFIGALAITASTQAQQASFIQTHAQFFTPDELRHIGDLTKARQAMLDAKDSTHVAGSDPSGHVTATFAASGDISNITGTDNRSCYWFQVDSTGGVWYGIPYATAGSGILISKIELARSIVLITGTNGPVVSFTQTGLDPARCGNTALADDILM